MKQISRANLITDFNRVAEDLGKRPTLTEYNEHGEYSSTPIYKRFESFEELKEAAGFETGQKKIADEDLIEDLQRVADEIGRSPPVEVYDEHGKYNHKTLKDRFGNWNQVLQRAGLEPTEHSEHWKDNEPVQFDKEYGTVEVQCSNCEEVIKRRPHAVERYSRFYCDRDCKHEFMETLTAEQARAWEGGKVTVHCEVCTEPKKVRPAKVDKSRFCSQDCMIEWRTDTFSGENHPHWKGGYNRYYGPNWYTQRDKTLERDGYQCQICDMDREEHQENYDCNPVVHHIIRFGDFDSYKEANKLSNLIALCKQCHGLVEGGKIDISEAGV